MTARQKDKIKAWFINKESDIEMFIYRITWSIKQIKKRTSWKNILYFGWGIGK